MTIAIKDIKNRKKLLRLAQEHNVLRVGSAERDISTKDAINIIKMATKREYGLPEKYYHLLK